MIMVWLIAQHAFIGKFRRPLASLSLVLLLGVSWGTMGCESDPLLAPQSDEKEEKGSYGFSSFPGDKADPGAHKKSNPELF